MGEIIKERKCLLVTGTIVPNSSFVIHTNAEQRKNEYISALRFYRKEFPDMPVYFLENSSFNFSEDAEFENFLSENKIELIKFPPSVKFSEGKGYQEFEMLDHAVDKLSGKYDTFIKVTGRYRVLNIRNMVDVHCKTMVMDLQKQPRVAHTNFFISRFDFYRKNIMGLYQKANDTNGIFIENVVYAKIISAGLLAHIRMFPSNPLIAGTSGSYGGTLNRNKYKMMLRNFERKIMRVFGIRQFLTEY